ncbi:MAG: hypothetical protein R3F11_30440 [Verrucomicrobiales bacterium]
MLVKELRQGMRTKMFTAVFITVQAVMGFFMLLGFTAGGASALFWLTLYAVLIIFQPLRGFSALSNEIKLQTMDLIQLTRLTAWRIALGKYTAIVAQSALFTASVLPYAVMRYYFGGIDVQEDLVWLFLFFATSCLLTAATVCFSAFPNLLVRGAVLIGLIFAAGAITVFLGDDYFDRDRIPFEGEPYAWLGYVGIFALVAYACYFLLDMGASQIAPEAENHASRKRAISFIAAGVPLALGALTDVAPEPLVIIGAIIAGVACFDALAEKPVFVPSVYAPFVRRGFLGRLAGRLLYPGWPFGIWYSLLMAAMAVAAIIAVDIKHHGGSLDDEVAAVLAASFGASSSLRLAIRLSFSAAWRISSGWDDPHPCGVLLFLTLLGIMMGTTRADEVALLGLPVPLASFPALLDYHFSGSREIMTAVSLGFSVLYFAVIAVSAITTYSRVRGIEASLGEMQRGQSDTGTGSGSDPLESEASDAAA